MLQLFIANFSDMMLEILKKKARINNFEVYFGEIVKWLMKSVRNYTKSFFYHSKDGDNLIHH